MHNNEARPAGPLVLVAEDEPAIRLVLEDLLSDEGYRVQTAADGAAALDIAERDEPAVILLDLGLPLLDGPEFCRAYREGGGEAPVVLVTAANQAIVETAMEACGAAAYIPKPFTIEAVLETVARLVEP